MGEGKEYGVVAQVGEEDTCSGAVVGGSMEGEQHTASFDSMIPPSDTGSCNSIAALEVLHTVQEGMEGDVEVTSHTEVSLEGSRDTVWGTVTSECLQVGSSGLRKKCETDKH